MMSLTCDSSAALRSLPAPPPTLTCGNAYSLAPAQLPPSSTRGKRRPKSSESDGPPPRISSSSLANVSVADQFLWLRCAQRDSREERAAAAEGGRDREERTTDFSAGRKGRRLDERRLRNGVDPGEARKEGRKPSSPSSAAKRDAISGAEGAGESARMRFLTADAAFPSARDGTANDASARRSRSRSCVEEGAGGGAGGSGGGGVLITRGAGEAEMKASALSKISAGLAEEEEGSSSTLPRSGTGTPASEEEGEPGSCSISTILRMEASDTREEGGRAALRASSSGSGAVSVRKKRDTERGEAQSLMALYTDLRIERRCCVSSRMMCEGGEGEERAERSCEMAALRASRHAEREGRESDALESEEAMASLDRSSGEGKVVRRDEERVDFPEAGGPTRQITETGMGMGTGGEVMAEVRDRELDRE